MCAGICTVLLTLQGKQRVWRRAQKLVHDSSSPVTLNFQLLDLVLGQGSLDIVKGHDVARGLSVVDVQRLLIRLAGVGVCCGSVTPAVELLLPMLPRNRQTAKPNMFTLQIRDVSALSIFASGVARPSACVSIVRACSVPRGTHLRRVVREFCAASCVGTKAYVHSRRRRLAAVLVSSRQLLL